MTINLRILAMLGDSTQYKVSAGVVFVKVIHIGPNSAVAAWEKGIRDIFMLLFERLDEVTVLKRPQ